MDLDTIPLVQAKNYTKGRTSPIELIVIHDMEAGETDTTAEAIANMFHTTTRQASIHYCLDDNSIVRCVNDKDTAWHAPGANSNGIGLEHAGYASQRLDQWLDPYSTAMLHLSAQLTRELCNKYGLPKQFVNAEGLKAKAKGITTHWEVSKAFHKTDHTDPGPNFPMQQYIDWVVDADPHPPNEEVPVAASNAPVACILVHPPSGGYLEIGEDGGVFNFGGAPFFGSTGNTKLNQPITDAAWTPDYGGYYLLGRDGGIFAFGNAKHQGNVLWAG